MNKSIRKRGSLPRRAQARIEKKLARAARLLEEALDLAEQYWPDADAIIDSDTSSRLTICERFDPDRGQIISVPVVGWSGGMV